MPSLGEVLRAERERQGLSLADIERATKIRRNFLEALESDNLQALPGEVYARGFIRNYAQVLGLDPTPLLAQLPSTEREVTLAPPTEFRPMGSGKLGWVFLVIACTIAIGSGLYLYQNSGFASSPDPAPTTMVVIVPTAAPTEARTPTATASPTPQQTLSGSGTPGASPTAGPTRPAGTGTALANGKVTVALRAVERTWISTQVDGAADFVGTLEIGDQRTFSAQQSIVMTIGNAGGLEVTYNGRRLEPLGRPGEVLNGVTWTPSGMQRAQPTPPPAVSPQPESAPPASPSPATSAPATPAASPASPTPATGPETGPPTAPTSGP